MYCAKCGNKLTDDSKFCNHCGALNTAYKEPDLSNNKSATSDNKPPVNETASESQYDTKTERAVENPDNSNLDSRPKRPVNKPKKRIWRCIVFGITAGILAAFICSLVTVCMKPSSSKNFFGDSSNTTSAKLTEVTDDVLLKMAENAAEYSVYKSNNKPYCLKKDD